MIGSDVQTVAPELILAVFSMAALMWGVYMGKDSQARTILWAAAVVMFGLGLWIGYQPRGTSTAFGLSFINDGFARYAKVVILIGASIMLVLSEDYLSKRGLMKFEFPVLIVLAVVGMMMMVSAGDLMALYMGLELQSLSLYVVASFNRDSLR